MAKALKVVAAVASVVSLIPGPWQIPAQVITVAATIGSTLLQKKPATLGNATDIRLGGRNPTPYCMGRTYSGGTTALDVGYGATSGGVPNPNLALVYVDSLGPIGGYEAFHADHAAVTFSGGNAVGSHFHDRLYLAYQLGACPEATALAGPFGAIPNWGSAHKLSGLAARMLTLCDNREGKTYQSGIPKFGAVLNPGVLVYDQRQDSTYPGGSGSCRVGFESTYVGGAAAHNIACHAVTYAIGRWQGPDGQKKLVMGVGWSAPDTPAASPAEAAKAIDWPAWTEFANVVDANAWKIGGRIEEPASGGCWGNLKRICAAAGARPAWVGGKLTVLFPRPLVAVDTIDIDDLAEGRNSIRFMTTARSLPNVLVPVIRMESHHWEPTQLDEVRVDALLAVDGEEKREEWSIELTHQADQAAEVTLYEIYNRRERELVITCKVRLYGYHSGHALDLSPKVLALIDPLNVHGLAGKPMMIVGRRLIPDRAEVEFTFQTDDPAKHVAVLGATGGAGSPTALPTTEDLDNIAGQRGAYRFVTVSTNPLTSDDSSISIAAFDGTLDDGREVSLPSGSVTGLASGTGYAVFWSPATSSYSAVIRPALAEMADVGLIYVGSQNTSAAGVFPSPPPPPPGGGGGGYVVPEQL